MRVRIEVPADEAGVYLKPEMGALVSFLEKEKAPEKTPQTAAPAPAAPPAGKDA